MQTYDKINVIIIDDFSFQQYDEIINRYSRLITIRYIKLSENHGSGYARKIGLENSNADYVVFADSDDTFLNAFSIEKMVQCIESGNYDFASFGYAQEHGELEFSSVPCNATWIFSKIYSNKFLKNNNITFSDERFNEDVAFNQICYALTDNVYKSNDTLYLHHMNEQSVTKTHDYKCDDMNSFARNYLKAFKFVKATTELSERVQWQFLDGYLILYHFYAEMIRTKPKEYCNEFYNQIKNYYNAIFDFAHILICSDEFENHYFKILSSHGIHNKKLICTLDWYTFLNDCEFSRRKLLERNNTSLF